MQQIKKSVTRGYRDHGWLQSYHSFSFADYYNPNAMGYSVLRVLNDDRIQPQAGFPMHEHHNMEIISYILSGTISHEDEAGHHQQLSAGQFQLMHAGSGIQHSEYNAEITTPLHFLQIWITPNKDNVMPGYTTWTQEKEKGWQCIISDNEQKGSLQIYQQMQLSRYFNDQAGTTTLALAANQKGYLHIVAGEGLWKNKQLRPGDALLIDQEQNNFEYNAGFEALWFALPANS